jgi:hypothetical protein
MSDTNSTEDSRLLPILREGVAVIQMIFFKQVKETVSKTYADLDPQSQTMLSGAITNEVFGSQNMEEKFLSFRNKHQGLIEQELIDIKDKIPQIIPALSDALRIQVLCDNQEGKDSTHLLKQAHSFGLLPVDRDVPMPSAFMETVRSLGAVYKLIIPPVEIDTAEERELLN